jgi:hypothetical protein
MLKGSAALAALACSVSGAPAGHMKTFGEHRLPEGEIHVVADDISPEAFYRECVVPAKACMVRGVTKSWPAFQRWSNDSYLSSAFGHFNVTVEGKREDTGGKGKMPLKRFMDSMQSTGYVITEMPGAMFEDVEVPKIMRCGNLLEKCVEVNFWLSEGGTAGIMHKDPFNQFNCVVRGRKLWTIVDPKHIKKVPMVIEDGMPSEENSGGIVAFKFESVDLARFPSLVDVPYEQSWVEAGDCLYMPGSYLHQVTSPMGRNIQVSLLFAAHTALGKGFEHYGEAEEWDGATCRAGQPFAGLTDSRRLSEHPVQWVYPGNGPQSMGFGDPQRMRDHMLQIFSGIAEAAGGRATVAKLADAFATHCSGQIRTHRTLPMDDLEAIVEAITLLQARGRFGIHVGHGELWNNRKILVDDNHFLLPPDFIPKLHSAAKRQATMFFDEAAVKLGAKEGLSIADLQSITKLEYKSGLLAHYTAQGISGQYPYGANVKYDNKRERWVLSSTASQDRDSGGGNDDEDLGEDEDEELRQGEEEEGEEEKGEEEEGDRDEL